MEVEGLGKRVASLRKRRGLSQKALADKLQVNEDTVWKWENEVGGPPRLENFIALAEALDVSIDQLLRGEQAYASSLKKDFELVLAEKIAEMEARLDARLKKAGL